MNNFYWFVADDNPNIHMLGIGEYKNIFSSIVLDNGKFWALSYMAIFSKHYNSLEEAKAGTENFVNQYIKQLSAQCIQDPLFYSPNEVA